MDSLPSYTTTTTPHSFPTHPCAAPGHTLSSGCRVCGAGVGAGVDQFGGSSSSVVACFTPCIQCFPLPARDPDEYSFLMTSDLSLGGGVLELAVEKLSHGQSPLRMQQPPCPIHTPYTTLHGALASHLLYGFSLQHARRETTRRVHRSRASSTPTAHHHHHWQLLPFPHSTIASWRLIHWVPASQRTHRVYVSASRMHQHRRMWVAARCTRCRSRGVRAERA
jgi:hypothetical protein